MYPPSAPKLTLLAPLRRDIPPFHCMIARFGGEISGMVPPAVADALHQRFTESNEEIHT